MIAALTPDFCSYLVYNTANTSLSQCDHSEKFDVRLFEQEISLSICALIAFKKKLQDINLADMFESGHADIEIIALPNCDRIFAFTILEILELRELLSGAFTMLELNSVIHKELIRKNS